MKVRISGTVKQAFGRGWRKEVAMLINSALTAREMSKGKGASFTSPAQMSIDITLDKKGATVTARPDFLPEQDEYEIEPRS